jgi:hypothetical protein
MQELHIVRVNQFTNTVLADIFTRNSNHMQERIRSRNGMHGFYIDNGE